MHNRLISENIGISPASICSKPSQEAKKFMPFV